MGPLAALVLGRANRAPLDTVPIWRLADAGGLRGGVQGAAASLDSGLVLDIVSIRLLKAVRTRERLRVRGSGMAAWMSWEGSRLR